VTKFYTCINYIILIQRTMSCFIHQRPMRSP